MSSVGTAKGVLEIAKFGLYVSVPIFLMYTFANNSKNIQKFMGNVSESDSVMDLISLVVDWISCWWSFDTTVSNCIVWLFMLSFSEFNLLIVSCELG